MKILDVNDPKTKEFLQKIGQILVEVNFVELFVELLIWQLIAARKDAESNEQTVGRRITVRLTFMEKADLCRSLATERKGEEFTKTFTQEVYKKLKEIAEIRDDMAHSLWYIQYGTTKSDLVTEKLNQMKAYERGKAYNFEKAKKTVSIQEMEKCIDLINDVTAYLLHYGVNKL